MIVGNINLVIRLEVSFINTHNVIGKVNKTETKIELQIQKHRQCHEACTDVNRSKSSSVNRQKER